MENKILEKSYKMINKYNQKSKDVKKYGTEQYIYPAEIHMIEIIGSYEKITTTKLANILCITKGAVSQTATKLLQKGLIIKIESSKKNEIFISLSEEGKIAYKNHRILHKDMLDKISNIVSRLPKDSKEALEEIFDVIDKSLDKI